jgi:hypothetical protein
MTNSSTTSPIPPRRVAPAVPAGAVLGPIVIATVTALVMIVAALLLKLDMPRPVRIGIALLPVLPLALMFVSFTKLARRLDELWVRIQFEALALAFMTTAVATVAWGQLQRAGAAPELNIGFVWPVMAAAYAACFALTALRYH